MTAVEDGPLLAVGLTGGIGAGKTAVADRLVAKGAILIDADQIARDVVAPGGPAYQPLVDRFGTAVLLPDGTVDRPRLAAQVFADPGALADLNAITHPAIGAQMRARRAALAGTDVVAVLAIPLLGPSHRETVRLHAVVVVDCPTSLAIDRLVQGRGLSRADAEARVAAQISRKERLAHADYVVDNGGDLDHLDVAVHELWVWLSELHQARREAASP